MSEQMDEIERIAKEHLGISSFAKRDPSASDDYVLVRFKIRRALGAAFAAGRQCGIEETEIIYAERDGRRG